MATFTPYGKTPRLNREIIVTEKIDGTNGAIHIELFTGDDDISSEVGAAVPSDEGLYIVTGQSRNRIVTPNKDKQQTDNYGFARWVHDNAPALVANLGVGTHYGEWFGKGIARNYGLNDRWFALFAHDRYDSEALLDAAANGVNLMLTPRLYRGKFSQQAIDICVERLRVNGSLLTANMGGVKAEGVIVYHTAANAVFKVTLEDDELPKTLAQAS